MKEFTAEELATFDGNERQAGLRRLQGRRLRRDRQRDVGATATTRACTSPGKDLTEEHEDAPHDVLRHRLPRGRHAASDPASIEHRDGLDVVGLREQVDRRRRRRAV